MMGEPLWRWVAWFGLLIFFVFVGLVVWDQTKKRSLLQLEVLKRRQSEEARWKTIETELAAATNLPGGPQSCSPLLERAKEELYKSLDGAFGVTSRALSGRDLGKILTESHGVSPEICQSIVRFLGFAEMVRYSSGTGLTSGEDVHKSALEQVQAIRKICLEFPRNPLEKKA